MDWSLLASLVRSFDNGSGVPRAPVAPRAGGVRFPTASFRVPMPSEAEQAVVDLAAQLPDDCSWDDAMYQLYVRQKIAAGLAAEAAGRLADHEEVLAELEQCERVRDVLRFREALRVAVEQGERGESKPLHAEALKQRVRDRLAEHGIR